MTKSQSQTDAEILSSAKAGGDYIGDEGESIIHRRHTRSVHPAQCFCTLCSERRFEPFSAVGENRDKDELEWSHEPE